MSVQNKKKSSKMCCGFSLRGGTKAVGWSDVAVELGALAVKIVSIVEHVKLLNCYKQKCQADRPTEIGIIVTLDAVSIFIHVVELLIVVVILRGADQRNVPKCKIWVRTTEVLTALDAIIFVWQMILDPDPVMIAFMVPDLIYKIYTCGVVESFINEMRTYNGIGSTGNRLEDAFD